VIDPILPFDAVTERERSVVLAKLGIFDTPSDDEFDDIARLAAMVLGAESAAVTLLDDKRQWFKARHGIPFTETPREISCCIHAAAASEPLIVLDATTDERFRANPLVTCEGGIRFYAGFPLMLASGHCAGTLCALIPRPGLVSRRHSVDCSLILPRSQRVCWKAARPAASGRSRHAWCKLLPMQCYV